MKKNAKKRELLFVNFLTKQWLTKAIAVALVLFFALPFSGSSTGLENQLTNYLESSEDRSNQPNDQPQSINVSGKVLDSSGAPIPGVTVIIKGTSGGTITDSDGNFSLSEVPGDGTLVFSFIGLQTKEIAVSGQSTMSVTMEDEFVGLDEVVVIGFGSRAKKDLTGSIATIGSEDLEKVSAASSQFALQGNMSGVRVINTSGDPNAAPEIFVRGIGSWQGSGQPLYVIDGQIITSPSAGNEDVLSGRNRDTPPNLWTLVNPGDIESISVLKDASASAIYGSRGANGVVLITTKKGKSGEPTLEFNAYTGIQNIPHHDMLNTSQYVDILNDMYANNRNPDITIENQLYGRNEDDPVTRRVAFSPQFDPESPFYISSRDTYDWQEELTRQNALDQEYDIKVSGATDYVNYYLSAGYKSQESNFIGGDLERYTGSMKLDTDIKEWLTTGVTYRFSQQENKTNDYRDLVGLAEVAPWQPLRDENHQTGYAPVLDTDYDNWQKAKIYGQGTRDNYLALGNLDHGKFDLQRHMAQGFFEIKPITGLNIRGSLNLDYTIQDRQEIKVWANNIFKANGGDPANAAPDAPNSKGNYHSRVNEMMNYQADLMATYDKTFNKHRVTLTGVVQDQYHKRYWKDISGGNLLSVNIDELDRVGYSGDVNNNNSAYGLQDEKYWYGYVGRMNYIYDQKYYLDFSYRRDGSSGFAEDYRWGNFFSLSGAWRISSERFMSSLDFIDDLKLRGGYGEAGNDETVVGSYSYLSTVGGAGSYRFGSGNGDPIGVWYPAINVAGFPNPTLSWETVTTRYVGLDGLFLNNKVDLTVEVYNRRTDGIQQFVELPLSVGTNNPAFNIGVVENRGVDLAGGYNDRFGDFTLGISGNISFLTNEVMELYNDQPLDTGFGRVEVGRPIGHIWGYQVGGMFKSQEEIDAYYAEYEDENIGNVDHVAPGDLWFKDIGGSPTEEESFYSTEPDGIINSYDRTEIGNTIPGYTYGLNLNAGWSGIDLSVSFYGEGDVDKYNEVRSQLEGMSGEVNYLTTTLDRYSDQNTNTDIPRAVIGDPAGNNRYSDRYVESAAFFRLNSWQLGYTLPKTLLARTNNAVKSLRIYIGGQNNLYSFKWSGIDPVNDKKPLGSSFNMGLNVKF